MKKYAVLIFAIFCSLNVTGQYIFSTGNQVYEELLNPISIDEEGVWDEGTDFQIFFNFDFSIGGQDYTALNVRAGGGVAFPGLGNKELFVFHTPFGGYILRDIGVDSSISNIDYEISGVAGEKILKIQWQNAGFVQWYPTSSSEDYINFQVWLFESDNHIEVHFGKSITNPGTYGFPDGTSDSNPGSSFKFWFDDCSNILGLTGAANLPSYWYFDSCTPNYTFIDGTPDDRVVYFLFPTATTSISRLSERELSIYPIPARDRLFISDIPLDLEVERISIVDNLGRVVLEHTINENDNPLLEIPIDGVSAGTYYVVLQTLDDFVTKKIIILN